MYSYYCSKHGNSKSKCHNLHNVGLFFVSVQELHKIASEFSSRSMVNEAEVVQCPFKLGLGYGHVTMKYTHIYTKNNNVSLDFEKISNKHTSECLGKN